MSIVEKLRGDIFGSFKFFFANTRPIKCIQFQRQPSLGDLGDHGQR